MIVDQLEHASLYGGIGPRIRTALRYLETTDLAALAAGSHPIEGDAVLAKVQDYVTKPREQGFWEAHRAFIDVQYVVSGMETIGHAHVSRLKAGPYDAEADLIKLEGSGEFFVARAGTFVILFPHDAHMPALAAGDPAPVRKVVVKVRV